MSLTANLSITEAVANQNNLDVTLNTALETIDAWIGSKSNAYIMLPNPLPNGLANATLGSNNTVVAFKVMVYHTITVSTVSFYVSTASAGKFASVGLYNSGGTTLLIDSGPFSTTSTGIKTKTLSVATIIYPGTYYAAWTANDTVCTITGMTCSDTGLVAILNATSAAVGTAANASSVGQLPSTTGAITGSAQTVPVFKLQS